MPPAVLSAVAPTAVTGLADVANVRIETAVFDLDDFASVADKRSRRGLRRSAQSAPLIGREAELATVLRLLADPSVRLVNLVGRGGVSSRS
jgi:hypothetical protein